MFELEEKFANALHLLGQELYDLLEFNRTLTGVIINKTIHRPCYVRELKKNLFQLVSKLERHIIYRLRNTYEENTSLSLADTQALISQSESLKSHLLKEKRRLHLFKFLLAPYLHWLDILTEKTQLYTQVRRHPLNETSDYSPFIEALDRLSSQHKKTRSFVIPFWARWIQSIMPDNVYSEFCKHLEAIESIRLNDSIPQYYTLIIKRQLIAKALFPYKETFGEDYPTLCSNFDMTLAAITQAEQELRSKHISANNFAERLSYFVAHHDLDYILSNADQVKQIARENHEQTQALTRSSFFSLSPLKTSPVKKAGLLDDRIIPKISQLQLHSSSWDKVRLSTELGYSMESTKKSKKKKLRPASFM